MKDNSASANIEISLMSLESDSISYLMCAFPFVVLEGLDGTGKTTLAEAVAEQLNKLNVPTVTIHTPTEPYASIARLIIEQSSIEARFYFFLSAVIHASDRIRPLLDSSAVICDRYIYSTLAYHRAEGLDLDLSPENLGIVLPSFPLLLTVGNDGIRRTRITSRGAITEADRRARDDSGLVARIQREYSRFNLIPVETGSLGQHEVALNIASMVISKQR